MAKVPCRATVRSGQETNSSLPRLSGVTAAPAAVIVLLNRRRKRPIRFRLKNNLRGAFVPVQEWGSRGEGRETAGGTNGGRTGVGVERKQDVLGLYLLPLPLSHSSSYLRWSQSWLSFRCWPHSPGGASSARSAQSLSLMTSLYHPGSDQSTYITLKMRWS